MRWNLPISMCKNVTLTGLMNWSIKIWKHVVAWKRDRMIDEWVEIWDYVSLNDRNRFYTTKDIKVVIWKFCSIANNASFIAAVPHNYNCLTTYYEILNKNDVKYYGSTINIWHDVWVGKDAKILKWVTIWTGAVIWAGAVVTKDVPPYAIVWWCPAKVIKYRFPKEIIEKLLKSKRWDWDEKKIKQNYDETKAQCDKLLIECFK